MKQSMFGKLKRIVVWMLVLCLILTNSPLTCIKVRADETIVVCTINPIVKVGGISYTIPMSYITITDAQNKPVNLNEEGKCDLVAGMKYNCVISGAEMSQHTVEIIAPTSTETIDVEGNASDIRIAYKELDEFYVGDTKNAINDLGITWTWTSDKSDVASVNSSTGEITGIANGTVKVTRTSSVATSNDTALKNSLDVKVIGESDYSLNYTYGSKPLGGKENIEITITDSNNNPVNMGKNSQYTFVWGQTYYYNITEENGVCNPANSQSRSFVPKKGESSVDIKVDLVLPTFTLEGKDLSSSSTKVKSGEENIAISCDNVNSLYNSSDWKIKINNQDSKAINSEDITISTKNNTTIQYYYGEVKAKEYTITTFDSYIVDYYFEGQLLSDVNAVFNGNKVVNTFDANNTYTLESLSKTGLIYNKPNPNTYKVTTKYTEQGYRIDLSSDNLIITPPTIEINGETKDAYEFTYGETVNITIPNASKCLNGAENGWSWSCTNGTDSLNVSTVTISGVQSYQLSLTGNTDNEYTLKYVFGNGEVSSKEIKIKINRIILNATSLPAIEKPYDGNEQFEYSIDLNSDEGKNIFTDQEGNNVSDQVKIELKCEVKGTNVGEYTNIQIVEAKSSNNAYDVSNLIEKTGGYTVNVAKIEKAETTLKINSLFIYYMDQIGDATKSNFVENDTPIYNSIPQSLKQEIFDDLGELTISNNQCTINKTYDSANIQYTVTGGTDFMYSPQIIDYTKGMENILVFHQQQLEDEPTLLTGTKKWINSNEILVSIGEETTEKKYIDYYDTIQFKELNCTDGVVSTDIGNGVEETLYPKTQNGIDSYYSVILSKEEQYSTIALIVRVIDGENKDKTYGNTIVGDNGVTYSVVNLYLDDKGDVVSFEGSLGGTDTSETGYHNNILMKQAYKANGESIAFEISESVTDIKTVRYGFVKVENSIENDNVVNGVTWQISNKEDKQTVLLESQTDGDYIMFVEVTDLVGNQSIYASNSFVMDNTPPELHFYLNDKEVTKEELAKRIYKNKDQKVTIKAVENNIKNVEVMVQALDCDGNSITTGINTDDISQKIEDGIKGKDNTYEVTTWLDANYTIKIKVDDQMETKPAEETFMFTIDGTAPETGEVKVAGFLKEIVNKENGVVKTKRVDFVKKWNSFVERVCEVFAKDVVTVTLSAKDKITDVDIFYFMTDKEYTEEQLSKNESITWTVYDADAKPKTKINQREFVYMKVVDKANNVSYFNSKGIITDNLAPVFTSDISGKVNSNGFYNGDVMINVDVNESTGSTQNEASGLRYVGYRIESNGKIIDSKAIIDEVTTKTEKNFDIPMDTKTYNANDLKVYITAVDNAGNMTDSEKNPIELKMDSTIPIIDIDFDDEKGAENYNHTRTATITITERNLDVKDVDITIKTEHGSKVTIGEWKHSDNVGQSDAATHTCKVIFDADDDYEFYVDCKDKAGNKAKTSEKHVFTVDKTTPIIDVSYTDGQIEENGYYNNAVTATITITEHNFDASKADIQISSPDGLGIGASSFSNNGDKHTTSVVFDQDGTYSLDVAFADKAGNEANTYNGNTFHVDLKEPVVEITNVKDKSANKDDVKPVITCTDENYDGNKVTITVRGANTGEVSLEKLNVSSKTITNGEEFTLTFPKEEAMDDVYTLTAKMEDKAGNETEDSVQFSVNRYGSVYTLGTETGEWLTNGVCSYIQEGRPVVIVETNVDEVTERNISYTAGAISAETVTVNELADCTSEEKSNGTYFESKEIGTGGGWYQYQYTVAAENFIKEGQYSIQIDSKDKAGNHTSNVSNKHNDSNLEILFAVDQTAPSAVVSGTENGGVYREERHTVMLDVQDNLALSDVTVYLNGEEYATYSSEEISELESGLIPVEVGESILTQTIQLKATDMAGNMLGEKVDGEYDRTFEDFNLIVTQNIFVQVLHTYWLFILIGILLVAGIIIFIIAKQKKKEE